MTEVSHEKKLLLSMKYLIHRDLYNGLPKSQHNWVGFHPQQIP